jgi:hypothetical protein
VGSVSSSSNSQAVLLSLCHPLNKCAITEDMSPPSFLPCTLTQQSYTTINLSSISDRWNFIKRAITEDMSAPSLLSTIVRDNQPFIWNFIKRAITEDTSAPSFLSTIVRDNQPFIYN